MKAEETQTEYRRDILSGLADTSRKVDGLDQDVAKVEPRGRHQVFASP